MNTGSKLERKILAFGDYENISIWKIHEEKNQYGKNISTNPFDFFGFVDDIPICFDAKSTKNKTSLPLNNIKEHQIKELKKLSKKGVNSFLLIEFSTHKRFFIMKIDLINEINQKSISIKFLEENAFEFDLLSFDKVLNDIFRKTN